MSVDDEKQASVVGVDEQNFKLEIKETVTANDLKPLDAETQKLFNHKCKYTLGKDNTNVTFYPSPHLYDKDGNFDIKSVKSLNVENVEKSFSLVCGAVDCDAIEGAFTDHNKELQNVEILENYYELSHGFIRAVETAWAEHYPLKLDPTHIWLLILQAVATHVDQNAEKLRKKWVEHEGKKELIVRRDDFIKGARDRNDWSEIIDAFCDQIDKNTVGDTVKLLESDFSNATIIDQIATKVTIMDICKNYFEYTFMTCCGFPQITLTGNKNDWIKLYTKCETLLKTKVDPKFGQQWGDALLPILARFIGAFEGKIDCLFWNSMIKRGGEYGSGGWEWYSGWINVFFPIIQNSWNQFCVPYCGSVDYIQNGLKQAGRGNDTNYYPKGLASAPVNWKYYSLEFKLKFISGFVGVSQNKETKELSPMIGWVIGEQTKQNAEAVATMKSKFEQNKDLIQPK